MTLRVIDPLVLDEKHRVIVSDGRLEQPLDVVRRGGEDDFDAGRVNEATAKLVGPVKVEEVGVVQLTVNFHSFMLVFEP